MTDNEITEAYFVALGWSHVDYEPGVEAYWESPDGETNEYSLPDILESYSAFKEHVLEVMEEEGISFNVCQEEEFGIIVWKNYIKHGKYSVMNIVESESIKSNNILHAAVIGATNYFKSKEPR